MAKAEIHDEELVKLEARFMEKDLVKQVPGTRYNYQDGCWYAPLSWGVAWALRGVFGSALEVGPKLQAWSQEEYARRVEPALALRDTLTVEPEGNLYGFQEVGVRFLTLSQRALLADEMGTGKTVQTIVALRRQEAIPALIVTPNSMTRTWKEEFTVWWPEARVEVLDGNATQRRALIERVGDDIDVLVTNWEKLRLHSRLAPYGSIALKKCEICEPTTTGKQINCHRCEKELNTVTFTAIVADEAHRMKNPKAAQTRALWWLSRGVRVKYALTGTPIANRPDDLWSLMHFVAPEDWPSKSAFVDRYCLSSWNPWGSLDIVGLRPQTREEFFSILDPRFLRRTKLAVLPQLPDKIYTTRYVDLTPKQAKAYRDLVKGMLAELEGGIAAVTNGLTKILRMLQLTSAYAEMDGDQWRLHKPSTKLDAMMEIIEEAGDQQLAVFAESRQLIQLAERDLNEAGIPYASIHGEVIPSERQLAIKRLNDGDIKVILATLGAGGEGLTLTAASTLVFLERSYSMVKNRQAEDRLHRIGQTAPHVEIIDIIARDTVDENRLEVVQGKGAKLEEIVRDEEQLRRLLNNE